MEVVDGSKYEISESILSVYLCPCQGCCCVDVAMFATVPKEWLVMISRLCLYHHDARFLTSVRARIPRNSGSEALMDRMQTYLQQFWVAGRFVGFLRNKASGLSKNVHVCVRQQGLEFISLDRWLFGLGRRAWVRAFADDHETTDACRR